MTATTLARLAEQLGLEYDGSGATRIDHVAALEDAGPGALTFLADSRYKRHLAGTRAAVIVMTPELALQSTIPVLRAANPHLAFARAAALVMPARQPQAGVHPTAWVDPEATLGRGVAVGPHASIGRGCRVGENVQIGPGCTIGEEVEIGDECRLLSRVTVQNRCLMGKRCVLQPGVVIGADGFGYAHDQGRWEQVPQLGRVRLGNDVDIGANSTVDRGAIGDTVLGDGVKLDNLVQIGHNVQIGDHTIIAGCVGIAGSTRIGRNCAIGGATGIAGHITLADGVQVTGMTQVTKSLKKAGIYSSGTGVEPNRQWRRNAGRFHQLDTIAARLRDLEQSYRDGYCRDAATANPSADPCPPEILKS